MHKLNLPAVRVKPADRRDLIAGSDNCVITGSNKAPLLRLWREKPGEPDLLKWRSYGDNAGQAPVGLNIEALSYANAAFFLKRLLRRS